MYNIYVSMKNKYIHVCMLISNQSILYIHVYSNFASLLEYRIYTNLYVPSIKQINELNEDLFPMSYQRPLLNIWQLQTYTH